MNGTIKQPETLENFCNSLGLEYKAEFVPFSKSRHKDGDWQCLNWKITLSKGGVELVTDYSQGIGHVPTPKNLNLKTPGGDKFLQNAIENGRIYTFVGNSSFNSHSKGKNIDPPKLRDVMYSLALDSDAIDCTFEEWASNYGYDTDSRKAEAIYRQCLEIGSKLRRVLGDGVLEELRTACQDY